jgi:hypothetical protein
MAKEVTFISKYTRHMLVRRPKMEVPLATGGWVPSQQRVAYQFEPSLDRASGTLVGQLTVREGQDVLDTDHAGTVAGGKDIGVKRDAVQFLRDHPAFGDEIWELGHEPGTVYPRPQDWRTNIRKATIKLDEQALVDMINEERRTHGRGDLIAEAEDALKDVRSERAEIEAEAAAAKPAAKKAPATA